MCSACRTTRNELGFRPFQHASMLTDYLKTPEKTRKMTSDYVPRSEVVWNEGSMMVGRGELTEEAWGSSRRCSQRAVGGAANGATTAQSSTASWGSCAPARPGGTCWSATDRGRPAPIDSTSWRREEPGTGFWHMPRRAQMP